MKLKTSLTLLAAAMLTVGCSDDSNYDFDQSVQDAQEKYSAENPIGAVAIFNPTAGEIPTTNDLLRSGSTDGTLNLPIDTTASESSQALIAALNTLDGFSTVAPITANFGTAIDATTATLGGNIHVFELQTTNGVPSGIAGALTAPTQMVATVSGTSTLALVPTAPLKPKTSYLVVITNGMQDTDGNAYSASSTYQLAKSTSEYTGDQNAPLELLRQAVNGYETLASAAGINRDNIVLSWSFTTQSVGDVMADVYDDGTTGTFVAAPTLATTKAFLDPTNSNPAVTGNADVYIGTLDVPYFSAIGASTQDTGPITASWRGAGDTSLTQYNTAPAKTGDLTIPVLITVPNGSSAPAGGWPVAIFQHGITQNRTNSLAIAEAMANAGFMTVSIDLALHGLTDTTNPLHADNTAFADTEQTFALDLVNNTTGASGPDGTTDASGTHFINLSSLLTSRDNIRQSVSNLFVLTNSLGNLAAATAAPVPSIDTSQIRFIGHSLGGVVGTTYLAHETQVGSATLAMPGGGIAQLLNNSATFGPRIKAGLAANGIEAGTADFESFMVAAQWAIDSADPINNGAAAAAGHAIHMIEVVGGNSGEPDQVIPNSVATAPLSGTEPLAAVMGLSGVSTSTSGSGLVRFVAGDHSSILDPSASLEATVEMQTETATFAATNGSTLLITDTSVVQQ